VDQRTKTAICPPSIITHNKNKEMATFIAYVSTTTLLATMTLLKYTSYSTVVTTDKISYLRPFSE
jgi:hypothetical protein